MRRALTTITLLLTIASCSGDTDGAQDVASTPGSTATPVGTRDCRFPAFFEVRPPWRLQARDFQMRRYLEAVLTKRYGRVTKVDPGPRLANGLIGFTSDADAREFVAVVDPGLIDVGELDTALKQAARAKLPELKPGPAIRVRAQTGCHTAAALREAYDVLREYEDRRPRVLTSSIRLAPESSAFRVTVHPNSPVTQELRNRLGDRVIVEEVVFRKL